MFKPIIRMLTLAAVAVGLLAPSASAQESARIHLIHGIPGVAVDVRVDGQAVFENFEFGDVQDLSALAGTTLTNLQVTAAGTDNVVIDGGDVALPSSGNYTVIAHLDATGTPTLGVFSNDMSPTAAGEGRLIVRHTAAAPAVDVLANGSPAFTNVSNPEEGSADLPAGTISASVVPTGATEPVVIGPADLTIANGQVLIVYAVGSLDDGSLTVLTETIDGVGTVPAAVNTGNSPVESSSGPSVALFAAVGLAGLATLAGARRLAAVKTR